MATALAFLLLFFFQDPETNIVGDFALPYQDCPDCEQPPELGDTYFVAWAKFHEQWPIVQVLANDEIIQTVTINTSGFVRKKHPFFIPDKLRPLKRLEFRYINEYIETDPNWIPFRKREVTIWEVYVDGELLTLAGSITIPEANDGPRLYVNGSISWDIKNPPRIVRMDPIEFHGLEDLEKPRIVSLPPIEFHGLEDLEKPRIVSLPPIEFHGTAEALTSKPSP